MFELLKYSVLFTTFDIEQYSKVKKILENNNIFYIHRTRNNTHGNSGLGKLGENENYSTVFEILVKKVDYEKARYLTNVL